MRVFCKEAAKPAALAGGVLLVAMFLAAACGKSTTTTSPTPATGAPASITETFVGTLPVGGSKFYSFSTALDGMVTATLANVEGDGVPSSVVVNLGIGTPSGFGCPASGSPVQVDGIAQLGAVVTLDEPPGVHCVLVADIGNLFAPATFTVTIDHP
jgi:hypothetical protein